MNQPPNAPLTEEDAEVVVLALGPRLPWFRPGGSQYYHVATIEEAGIRHRYCVSLRQAESRWNAVCVVTHRCPHPAIERILFDSVETAKAACERHFATGEWE